jgi:long-chain acyl-CoA synthetase
MSTISSPSAGTSSSPVSPQNCLQSIFAQLEASTSIPLLHECRETGTVSVNGGELLAMVSAAREWIRKAGVKRGDRCCLLAENGIRWVAANLAILSEGLICVPLYSRQAPAELEAMMQDCEPVLLLCGTEMLRDAMRQAWTKEFTCTPQTALFSDVFVTSSLEPSMHEPPVSLAPSDPLAIIYTSGTSGVAKGVILTVGNVTHMLGCTSSRLDLLMQGRAGQDRVFHYLPFCFAGSWILLLTSLLRGSLLTLNMDLNRLAADLLATAPDYALNVPALLERMRRAVDEQMQRKGGWIGKVYANAKNAVLWRQSGSHAVTSNVTARVGFWLWVANRLVFPAIKKKMFGPNLRALISGSAPLMVETQMYFQMLGVPVLQVYGLTETTAICTLDDPRSLEVGLVGPVVPGVEMKLGDDQEILVRGPNIFPGYWNRPKETALVLRDGWFHTGDQGEVNASGNWKIAGRLKNLVILSSGHNIAPEPIEDKILQLLPSAQQVVVAGNGRGYLSAIITGKATRDEVQTVLNVVNHSLPHYKQVRAFHICAEAFSIESGLLTANGKLKRDTIAARLKDEIADMYETRAGVAS